MNLIYKVIRTIVHTPSGNVDHVFAYARYNTCSDLWGEAVYKDLEMTELHGAYTCRNQYHGREEITLRRYHKGEPDFTMRYCTICECLVTPPFDGYTYHDYDCPMDESCKCDHPEAGPLTMKDVEKVSIAITENSRMTDWEHTLYMEQHRQMRQRYRRTFAWCGRLRGVLFAETIGARL